MVAEDEIHRRQGGETSAEALSDQVETVNSMWKAMQAAQDVYKKQAGDRKMLMVAGMVLFIFTALIFLVLSTGPGESPADSVSPSRGDSYEIAQMKSITINPQGKRADWMQYAHASGQAITNASESIEILLLGDHFEEWGGTQVGMPCPEASDCLNTSYMIQQELAPQFPGMYTAGSIAGDTTQNVLWRVTIDKGFDKVNPDVCVLQLGSADLFSGMRPSHVAAGVREVLKALQRRMMDTQFLLVGVLPRADDVYKARTKAAQNPGMFSFSKPKAVQGSLPFTSSKFYSAINQVNRWMEAIADEIGSRWLVKRPVYFLDCSHQFLVPHSGTTWHAGQGAAATEIPLALMPDMVHLSTQGHERLATCIRDTVRQLSFIAKAAKADKKARMAKLGK